MQGNRACVWGAVFMGVLSACAHTSPRVDCERRLQPINRPAAVERWNPSQSQASPVGLKSQRLGKREAGESLPDDHSAESPSTEIPERVP